MTKDTIQTYIRQCADLLGLKDWDIRFEDQLPENADAEAERFRWGQPRVLDYSQHLTRRAQALYSYPSHHR